MSPLAVARARGKSSDLTIWVTPHQEEKTGGTREGRKDGTCGVIICFRVLLQFFFSPSLCSGGWEGEKEEEEEGGGHTHTWVSSFFHPVSILPGAVQFLDPSLSISSRLLLSTSCSSLLPPHLSWSSLLWLETSKPGRCLSK